jgi:hypothetical protein
MAAHVHAPAYAAGTARDVDRIGRLAAPEDDLVAAEGGGFGPGLDDAPGGQVDDRVKGEGAGDAGDRIDVEGAEVGAPDHGLERLVGRGRLDRERLDGEGVTEAGMSTGVELDWQVLEAQGATGRRAAARAADGGR